MQLRGWVRKKGMGKCRTMSAGVMAREGRKGEQCICHWRLLHMKVKRNELTSEVSLDSFFFPPLQLGLLGIAL